jgi:type IV fimbrial biogenesis protein FimT
MVHTKNKDTNTGFTFIELMVVVAIIALLLGMAVPAFFAWRPNYQLRRAAKDLYSNFQMVKMEAIKTNQTDTITFNPAPANNYQFTLSGVTRTVNLADYGDGFQFGMGLATTAAPNEGGIAARPVTFNGSQTAFDSRGLVNELGYAYITNGTACFAVGVSSVAGVIAIHRNSGAGGGASWD